MIIRQLALLCFWLSLPCVLLSASAFVMDQLHLKLDWVINSDSRLYVGQGHVCWFSYDGGYAPGLFLRDAGYEIGIGGSSWGKKFLGIKYGEGVFGVGYAEVSILRPLITSFLILIVSVIAARLRKRRLRKEGTCVKCGYDLTGNVSGRCPECGTEIDQELLKIGDS